MKKIAILGSTGSVGVNSLEVIARFPKELKVCALSAFGNMDLLGNQAKRFRPQMVSINREKVNELRKRLNSGIKISNLEEGIRSIISKNPDLIVLAISGGAALKPLLEAVKAGKTIALANKEALVMAGKIIMGLARKTGARIIPIDSEQSAIFQCLEGKDRSSLKKIYLTASGGPLKSVPKIKFSSLTVNDVLRHPRWKMGRKISVDSATLMNKGLEVIEAMWLFDLKPEQIEVIIHKEAVIHSMVEFIDGTIFAQLGITDMRLPIQYAFTFPERWLSNLVNVDFIKLGRLSFEKPDLKKFPALSLAYRAAKEAGSSPCALNGANEIAVEAFLEERIGFHRIPQVIEKVLSKHRKIANPTLDDIISVDKWAKREAKEIIERKN